MKYDDYIITKLRSYKIFEYLFEKLRILGQGGYGKVYRTQNNYDQAEYAIKVISLDGGYFGIDHIRSDCKDPHFYSRKTTKGILIIIPCMDNVYTSLLDDILTSLR